MLGIVPWKMFSALNAMSGDTTETIVPDSKGAWRRLTTILMLDTSREILRVVRIVDEVETEAEAVVEQLELKEEEEVRFLMSGL